MKMPRYVEGGVDRLTGNPSDRPTVDSTDSRPSQLQHFLTTGPDRLTDCPIGEGLRNKRALSVGVITQRKGPGLRGFAWPPGAIPQRSVWRHTQALGCRDERWWRTVHGLTTDEGAALQQEGVWQQTPEPVLPAQLGLLWSTDPCGTSLCCGRGRSSTRRPSAIARARSGAPPPTPRLSFAMGPRFSSCTRSKGCTLLRARDETPGRVASRTIKKDGQSRPPQDRPAVAAGGGVCLAPGLPLRPGAGSRASRAGRLTSARSHRRSRPRRPAALLRDGCKPALNGRLLLETSWGGPTWPPRTSRAPKAKSHVAYQGAAAHHRTPSTSLCHGEEPLVVERPALDMVERPALEENSSSSASSLLIKGDWDDTDEAATLLHGL